MIVDIYIAYEFGNPHFCPKYGEWTFTSNGTGAGILAILNQALSEFDVYKHTWLVGYNYVYNLNVSGFRNRKR